MKAYITRPALLAAIESVRVAASTDSTRYGLTGVRARFSDTSLELAATDGCRAHKATIPATSGEAGEILYSADSLGKLAKALKAAKPKRGTDELTIEITGSTAKIGDDTISLSVEPGQFPALEAVIPPESHDNYDIFGINPAFLSEACESAAKMDDRRNKIAKIVPGPHRLAPIRVDMRGSYGQFLAVIMPVRMD